MGFKCSKHFFVYNCLLMYLFLFFKSSFVYVFDGLPRFLANGVVHSDDNLIGAFCGTTRSQPITVEATSGVFPFFVYKSSVLLCFLLVFLAKGAGPQVCKLSIFRGVFFNSLHVM